MTDLRPLLDIVPRSVDYVAAKRPNASQAEARPDPGSRGGGANPGTADMSVRYRPMTRGDIQAGMRLTEIAGWNQKPADWERFLTGSPGGCFVAEYLDRVIGTSASIVYGGQVAWVSMVLVDPIYRGQGVGTVLLERVLEHLDARSIPCMKLDATPLGRPIYEREGFVSECDVERWELHRPAAAPQRPEQTPLDLEGILALDLEVFGVDRGQLLRSIANGAPDLAIQRVENGRVTGYALGRRGALADHLGPWVVSDQDSAAAVLDEFLARSGREMVFADCLPQNEWVMPLFESRGFELSRPLTRMYRGTHHPAGTSGLIAAITGPEFG
jgi:GNAT superfamily N-acetyltransferase